MISILHYEFCKRNDKKTYQVSKHHTNELEDLSSRIKLYPDFNVKGIFRQ